jgi:hypothetical protein
MICCFMNDFGFMTIEIAVHHLYSCVRLTGGILRSDFDFKDAAPVPLSRLGNDSLLEQ